MSKKRKRASPSTTQNHSKTTRSVIQVLTDGNFEEYCKRGYVRFDNYPDVKVCIKIYADLISSMTIHLMKNTDSGDIRIKNGLSRLLDIEPYKYTTRKTLMYKVVEELLLTGNSILLPAYDFQGKENYLRELKPIAQSQVTYKSLDDSGYSVIYNKHEFQHDEILHFVNIPNIETPYKGESFKIYLNDVLNSLKRGQEIKTDYYTKHYKPSIVFSFNTDADLFDGDEQREELHDKWLKTKPGTPYILPAALIDFKSFPAMSLSDMALDANIKLDKTEIANIFGIPPFLVGIGTFNKEEYNNFINTRINPICKEIEQEMTRKIILSPDYYVKLNIDSIKVFNQEAWYDFMLNAKTKGIYNANEIRVDTGYEPIDTPAMNEFNILENYIPVDKIGSQKKLNNTGGDK